MPADGGPDPRRTGARELSLLIAARAAAEADVALVHSGARATGAGGEDADTNNAVEASQDRCRSSRHRPAERRGPARHSWRGEQPLVSMTLGRARHLCPRCAASGCAPENGTRAHLLAFMGLLSIG